MDKKEKLKQAAAILGSLGGSSGTGESKIREGKEYYAKLARDRHAADRAAKKTKGKA